MSVVANKRGLSSMQFYKLATDISKDITNDLLRKLTDADKVPDCPAFFVRYIRERILNEMLAMTEYIVRGNSIYPTTLEDLAMRRQFQNHAIGYCNTLSATLNYCVVCFPKSLHTFMKYAEQLDHLQHLLRRWKQSNNKIERRIKENSKPTVTPNSTNFVNVNNNGNVNNNNASNSNGVPLDFTKDG